MKGYCSNKNYGIKFTKDIILNVYLDVHYGGTKKPRSLPLVTYL